MDKKIVGDIFTRAGARQVEWLGLNDNYRSSGTAHEPRWRNWGRSDDPVKRNIFAILFFIALILIAIALYLFWNWVLRPLGVDSLLTPHRVDVLNRIVFGSYSALFAIICVGNAVVALMDKKPGQFLTAVGATTLSVALGAIFVFRAGQFGAGALAFGVPMLLALTFGIFRPFKGWLCGKSSSHATGQDKR